MVATEEIFKNTQKKKQKKKKTAKKEKEIWVSSSNQRPNNMKISVICSAVRPDGVKLVYAKQRAHAEKGLSTAKNPAPTEFLQHTGELSIMILTLPKMKQVQKC